MPSYRLTVDIVGLRDGVAPEQVLPAAEAIVARTHLVEDRLLDVADASSPHPRPQVHLRYLVPPTGRLAEDSEARAVAQLLVAELDGVARCGAWQLRRGPGRRWTLVATGPAHD